MRELNSATSILVNKAVNKAGMGDNRRSKKAI